MFASPAHSKLPGFFTDTNYLVSTNAFSTEIKARANVLPILFWRCPRNNVAFHDISVPHQQHLESEVGPIKYIYTCI